MDSGVRLQEQRLQGLIDRQDILDCLTRFCRGIDRFDTQLFLSAFHPDATIAAGPFVGNPRELAQWAFAMHQQMQLLTQHNLLNHSCDIEGDGAHCETYYQFAARNLDESVMLAGGRYIDRLEKRDGAWKIALRTNVIEWSCLPPALPLPFGDVPDIGLNGIGARSREDISYLRPLINRRQRNIPGE